ncbi:MAG: putative rRNA maturation factor [Cellvibrionaceae bacterium]|jgi:probable rRNA maturation factor
MVEIDLQVADVSSSLPAHPDFLNWVTRAVNHRRMDAEVSIRIVTEDESRSLNYKYRGKNTPTNVLSFPTEFPPGVEVSLLGDLVICANIVTREAKAQNKSVQAHWAHMVIHGTLHLLGYQHAERADAEKMESLEIEILHHLGYGNPYELID